MLLSQVSQWQSFEQQPLLALAFLAAAALSAWGQAQAANGRWDNGQGLEVIAYIQGVNFIWLIYLSKLLR